MNPELRELYQEIILDHNKNPRNQRVMQDANVHAEGFNPLCGDRITVYLKVQNDRILEVSFVGAGCAISQASASMMTETVLGKTVEEAHHFFHQFHTMLTTDNEHQAMDKLSVLAGVKAFPARVKCATLAWHTMEAALKKDAHTVSTE